jgi:hypothetical protein
MDAAFAILVLGAFAIIPIALACGFAGIGRAILLKHKIPLGRWAIIPLILLGFALTAFSTAAIVLTYQPEALPGLFNPVLVLMVLDGILMFPLVSITVIRCLALAQLRDRWPEAALNFAASAAYGLLYIPYRALEAYYPHV